jgi:hypothetical protein
MRIELTPGSEEARKYGCNCSGMMADQVLARTWDAQSPRLCAVVLGDFVINLDCPIHGVPKKNKKRKAR